MIWVFRNARWLLPVVGALLALWGLIVWEQGRVDRAVAAAVKAERIACAAEKAAAVSAGYEQALVAERAAWARTMAELQARADKQEAARVRAEKRARSAEAAKKEIANAPESYTCADDPGVRPGIEWLHRQQAGDDDPDAAGLSPDAAADGR